MGGVTDVFGFAGTAHEADMGNATVGFGSQKGGEDMLTFEQIAEICDGDNPEREPLSMEMAEALSEEKSDDHKTA